MSEPTMLRIAQHGSFVCRLRAMFFRDTLRLQAALLTIGVDFLRSHWNDIGRKRLENDENAIAMPADGLHLSSHVLRDRVDAMVMSLPPPQMTPDPFFVALVFPPKGVMIRTAMGAATDAPRFMTLELSNAKLPFVCEWSASGSGDKHSNFGEVCEPTLDAFLDGVSSLILDQAARIHDADRSAK